MTAYDLKSESVGTAAASGAALGAMVAVVAVSSSAFSPVVGAVVGGVLGFMVCNFIYYRRKLVRADASGIFHASASNLGTPDQT